MYTSIFLTIVDDHSRATWVYLMRTKDEVIKVFPSFVAQVENQYKVRIKAVRSGNASELKFSSFFQEKGIISYHSCPETLEQNSVVERKHLKCCKSLHVSVSTSSCVLGR